MLWEIRERRRPFDGDAAARSFVANRRERTRFFFLLQAKLIDWFCTTWLELAKLCQSRKVRALEVTKI